MGSDPWEGRPGQEAMGTSIPVRSLSTNEGRATCASQRARERRGCFMARLSGRNPRSSLYEGRHVPLNGYILTRC